MKVCFDANVVIDILGITDDFKDSFTCYDVACLRGWDLYIPASTIGTISYVLGSRKMKTKVQARNIIGCLPELFNVIDLTAADCLAACESDMKDYKDAEVAYSALRAGVDVIVTRNKRNFAESPVAAMAPSEFLAAYQPKDYSYDLEEIR